MDLSTTFEILLTWAVHLSNYPAPSHPPQIQFQPHSFFVERVCANKECRAVGWYNDEGIVYIDEIYRDTDSEFAQSLVVHELVHYLQHMSGKYDSYSCEDSIAREREAYYIQNEYILQSQASFKFVRPGPTACGYQNAAVQSEVTDHHEQVSD
ncbi:MAG: hypothetical protein H0W33_09085 [Gammaproteobacteria bacterium]|nr:hypothetical protein [Gammaproteobacteria bacterium]